MRSAATRARRDPLVAGLVLFGAYHLLLALFMVAAPGTFFAQVGPFGVRNDHYTRDVATYDGALGVAFLIAARRPDWRVPVLALAVVQFALHALNHLVDIDGAHPASAGPIDFALLLAGAVVLGLLLRRAARQAKSG